MAYAKKPKEIQNISDFADYKVIAIFEKKGSYLRRGFFTNDPEEWFLDVLHWRKKSGQITDNEGWIIAADLKDWTRWWEGLGWKKVEE